jgi:cell division protein FtsN
MNYLDAIKDKVDDQAMVLHDYSDGHTMYKVLIGRYNSHEEAAYARDRLRSSHGIDSIVY